MEEMQNLEIQNENEEVEEVVYQTDDPYEDDDQFWQIPATLLGADVNLVYPKAEYKSEEDAKEQAKIDIAALGELVA